MLKREEGKLHKSREYQDIFKAQGATEILNTILDIEQDIKQYDRDLQAGRVQPIVITQKEMSNGLV